MTDAYVFIFHYQTGFGENKLSDMPHVSDILYNQLSLLDCDVYKKIINRLIRYAYIHFTTQYISNRNI